MNGSRVLVIGVSYKADVNDTRESPALRVIELMRADGADVEYHDPHVAELPKLGLRSQDLGEALGRCDVAVVVTAHSGIDWAEVASGAPLVVDLRNVVPERNGKVWRL